jgi:hypothetical protein
MQGTNTNGGSSYGSLPDKIVFYASVFVYRPELKKDFMNFTPSLLSYECKYLRLKRSISKAFGLCAHITYRIKYLPQRLQWQAPRVLENEWRSTTQGHCWRKLVHNNLYFRKTRLKSTSDCSLRSSRGSTVMTSSSHSLYSSSMASSRRDAAEFSI